MPKKLLQNSTYGLTVASPRVPHLYQCDGVEWNVGHGGVANFLRPGKGKTAIMLRSLLALKDAGMKPRALIVAPLRVAHNVWPVEHEGWEGSEWERIKELRLCVLHGKNKDILAEHDAVDAFVINFDGLKWLLEDGLYKRFRRMRLDTLIWDESTRIKNTNTKRFKLMRKILPTFQRRWILTGTPMPRSYLDLFGQIFVVDLGRAFGPYITHFRQRYFQEFGMWNWVLKDGAAQQIEAKIAPYVFQPPETKSEKTIAQDNVIRIDLPEEARRVYDELEKELITELKNGETVIAVSSGVAAGKCAQVANGGLYHAKQPGDTRRKWTDLHTAKIEAVEEIVSELQGRPAMVVYEYEHDLARLVKAFPRFPVIGGGVSARESGRIIDAWNRDEFDGMLVQPKSVAHGINAQYGSCTDIIWHSLTYDYEDYDQLIKRLVRQGSRHAVIMNHVILARGTVDEAKWRSLNRKNKSQKGFMEAMLEYIKERNR